MKKVILIAIVALFANSIFAQELWHRYRLHPKWSNQHLAYYPVGTKLDTLKAGWVLEETRGSFTTRRTLLMDSVLISKMDSAIRIHSNWKVSELKHSNDAPDKLMVNPYVFKDSLLNNRFYLKIPENGNIKLTRAFFRFSAITIPFAIRPALNDTIGSKITTDLKIGSSFTYNYNCEIFKNRRIEAQKRVYGISFGIGFGFSKVTLDKNSTHLLKEPYQKSEDGLAFFFTPGIGFNLKGFQLAAFYGWDFGVTKNLKDWDYNNKPYYGIGLGVDLTTIGSIITK